jgi:hypothetical protein
MLSADSMSLPLATVHENGLVTISLLFSIAASAIFMAAKHLLYLNLKQIKQILRVAQDDRLEGFFPQPLRTECWFCVVPAAVLWFLPRNLAFLSPSTRMAPARECRNVPLTIPNRLIAIQTSVSPGFLQKCA